MNRPKDESHVDFAGKVALVTGASRGVGASVARRMGQHGADVVINFRGKNTRAEDVASHVRHYGRRALLAQADLTEAADLGRMADLVTRTFRRLDVLILNASGGLEKDRPESYAMLLNLTAQVRTVEAFLPLMPPGSCVVFVTSHWAHFHGQRPSPPSYEPIAASKKAGEDALRARIPELTSRGVRFCVVSGDMIEGTITPRLLERIQPGVLAGRRSQVGPLPTVEEFAQAIVFAAADWSLPSGHTVFVGSTK